MKDALRLIEWLAQRGLVLAESLFLLAHRWKRDGGYWTAPKATAGMPREDGRDYPYKKWNRIERGHAVNAQKLLNRHRAQRLRWCRLDEEIEAAKGEAEAALPNPEDR
jgi:hypothetical protein